MLQSVISYAGLKADEKNAHINMGLGGCATCDCAENESYDSNIFSICTRINRDIDGATCNEVANNQGCANLYRFVVIGKDGMTSPINGYRYQIPVGMPVIVKGSAVPMVINPSFDNIIKISNEYALLSAHENCRGGDEELDNDSNSIVLLLELVNPRRKQDKFTIQDDLKEGLIPQNEVLRRLSLLDIKEYLPQIVDETKVEYEKRLNHYNRLDSCLRGTILDLAKETNADFGDVSIKGVILFSVFLNSLCRDEEKKAILNAIKKENVEFFSLFISAFEVCEFNFSDGEAILQLLMRKDDNTVADILKYYSKLRFAITEIEKKSPYKADDCPKKLAVYKTVFYKKAMLKAARLLKDVLHMKENERFEEYLERTRAYLDIEILEGAILVDLLDIAFNEGISLEQITALGKNKIIDISVVRGGGHLKSTKTEDMDDDNNYNGSGFTLADWQMYKINIEKSVRLIDPNLCDYFLESLPKNIESNDAVFGLFRVKTIGKSNDKDPAFRTVAGVMVKQITESGKRVSYYSGSMYVDDSQQGIGLGEYLNKAVRCVIKDVFNGEKNSEFWGIVAGENPYIQRHLENGGGVVTEILNIGHDDRKSKDVYKVIFGRDLSQYVTKQLSKDNIRKLANTGKKAAKIRCGNSEVKIEVVDTSGGGNEQFMKKIKKDLEKKRFVLTRMFYDFNDGKPDLTKTYVVKERKVV